eukprot:gene22605-29266_t
MNNSLYSHGAVMFESLLADYSNKVRAILGTEKSQYFVSPENSPHSYNDKYVLAEQLTSCMGAVAWNVLMEVGISLPILKQLVSAEASNNSAITLRLEAYHSCKFIKEQIKKEDKLIQTEISHSIRTTERATTKEFFYEYAVKYQIVATIGVGETVSDVIVIRSRSATQELMTRFQQSLLPEVQTFNEELDISQLFSLLKKSPVSGDSNSLNISFSINRMHKCCFTPIRNQDIEAVVVFFDKMYRWLNKVEEYFTVPWRFKVGSSMDEIPKIASGIFIPLIPFFHIPPERVVEYNIASISTSTVTEKSALESTSGNSLQSSPSLQPFIQLQRNNVAPEDLQGLSGSTISTDDLSLLLLEHQRSLVEKLASLQKLFAPTTDPKTKNLLSMAEARLSALCVHLQLSIKAYIQLIRFIEDLIHRQLTQALGREISSIDFQLYMSFHYRKLYRLEFQPVPFSYAVRRSLLRTPEGTVRIEIQTDDARVFNSGSSNGGFQPIETFCRRNSGSLTSAASGALERVSEMSMPIDASTRIRFQGVRYVHGWLAQSFLNSSSPLNLRMVATARQFSCYIVLLGSISSATTFEPKFAILVQNKDELSIPLLLDTIPNLKQFRDSIDSLSPEQQRFAKAYRAMQLESTLFGIVLLQVKPQLEKVLQLRPDSLTKEITLTQDIMKLFIDYQIPADLLSFNESSSAEAMTASAEMRVSSVRANVKKITDILNEAKREEVLEMTRQRECLSESAVMQLQQEPVNEVAGRVVVPPPSHFPNLNVFFLGVGRMEKRFIIMASHCYQADTDLAGVKLVFEQPNRIISPGKHYSFTAAQFTWHFTSDDLGIIYILIAHGSYPQRTAWMCLQQLQREFIGKVGDKATSARDRAFDKTCSALLMKLCQKFDNLAEVDKLAAVAKKIETIKLVMPENVDLALQNCVRVESVERAAEELQQAAGVFKRSAKQLNNKTWWSSIIPTPSSFRSTKTAAAVPPPVVAAAQKAVTTNRSQMTSVRIEPSPPSASALKETAAIQSRTAETILRLQQQASASESIGAQILEELCSQGQTLDDLNSDPRQSFEIFSGSWVGGRKSSTARETPADQLVSKTEICGNVDSAPDSAPLPLTQSAPLSDPATEAAVAPQPVAETTTSSDAARGSNVVEKVTEMEALFVEEEKEDCTKLPSKLEEAFNRLDVDHAVRPTIIKPGDQWQRARQRAFIISTEKPKMELLSFEDLDKERNAVFDLLDALTRSGALPIEDAAVHIVIGASHSFDDTVMNTVVQHNRKPIESIERS